MYADVQPQVYLFSGREVRRGFKLMINFEDFWGVRNVLADFLGVERPSILAVGRDHFRVIKKSLPNLKE